MKTIHEINRLPETEWEQALQNCCGSTRWVRQMLIARPYESAESIFVLAENIWCGLGEDDFLEAFSHHPKIGDRESLKKKFASTAHWAGNEQSGVNAATEAVIEALAKGNEAYEHKFGFIFIVCATGKSAEEMLAILQARLPNEREDELLIAAAEQAKITALRLQKWITE